MNESMNQTSKYIYAKIMSTRFAQNARRFTLACALRLMCVVVVWEKKQMRDLCIRVFVIDLGRPRSRVKVRHVRSNVSNPERIVYMRL